MTVEIRTSTPDELFSAVSLIGYYVGGELRAEDEERLRALVAPERLFAAFEHGESVGTTASYPFELTVPGGTVAAAGVAYVAVLPTHRRRGILTRLMRAQLDDLHERGEAVAYLWASEDVIYGRFGYGMASMTGEIDLPDEHDAFVGDDAPARARLLAPDEALEFLPQVYERVRLSYPGTFSRSRDWWRLRRLADPPERREGAGALAHVLVELDDGRAGYALYRHRVSSERGLSTSVLEVVEALADSPAATRALWRYLLDVDWVASVRASRLPLDHPLFFLLAEPRRMRFSFLDGLWVRLVDVGAALAARRYAAGGNVVFEVADGFCGWNEGRWRLEEGEAERTDVTPDLRLDVTALGTVYLGGYTFAQLARAGRLDELTEGAVERADAMFRTDRQPWCPEVF